jgi:endonuclease/exonuclease/phosphatase family metal-dependent hydrolase
LTGLYGAFGKAIDYGGGEYGQAILSRFPLEAETVHRLPGEPDREQRIAFEATVTISGQPLSFVSTHLHHQNAAIRERQAAKLHELFAGTRQTVILAGDLNATPDSQALSSLVTQWAVASGNTPLLTFPALQPTRQIDYVLVHPRNCLRTCTAAVLDEPTASDHRPVLAVIEFNSDR